MAILGVLGSLSVVAFGTIGSSQRLGTTAALVADLAEFARQQALANGVPTRLVVVTSGWEDGKEDRNLRSVSVLKREEQAGGIIWSPLRRWDVLPPGVSFSSVAQGSGMQILADGASPRMQISQAGSTLEVAYIEFLPSGQVRPEFPGGTSLVLVSGNPGDEAGENWAEVNANPITGKVVVNRP